MLVYGLADKVLIPDASSNEVLQLADSHGLGGLWTAQDDNDMERCWRVDLAHMVLVPDLAWHSTVYTGLQ